MKKKSLMQTKTLSENMRSHNTRSALQGGYTWDTKQNLQKAPAKMEPGVRSRKTDAAKSRKSREPKGLRPVNNRFSTAINYGTADMVESSSLCDNQVTKHVSKCPCRLQAQLKAKTFDSMHLILITVFLHAFNSACDNHSILELQSMWLISYFLRKSVDAKLRAHLLF